MRLFAFEKRLLAIIADAMLPSGVPGGLQRGAASVPTEAFLSDFEKYAPGESMLGVRAATWIITLLPLLWRFKLRPFGALRPTDRYALLNRLEQSRFYLIRELPNLLKIVVCMAWCSDPRVQRDLHFLSPDSAPPQWLLEASEPATSER